MEKKNNWKGNVSLNIYRVCLVACLRGGERSEIKHLVFDEIDSE